VYKSRPVQEKLLIEEKQNIQREFKIQYHDVTELSHCARGQKSKKEITERIESSYTIGQIIRS
jgi:hypothetical protein